MAQGSSDQLPGANQKAKLSANLISRVLSALVLIPFVLAVIYFGGTVFLAVVIMLALLMLYEWNNVSSKAGFSFMFVLQAAIVCASTVLIARDDLYGSFLLTVGGLVVLGIMALLFVRKQFFWVLLGPVYVLLFAASLVWIRDQPYIGLGAICWLVATVWCTDSGAYFAGKSIGGPLLAPKISPKKTWAGLVGGMVSAAVASVLVSMFFGYAPLHELAVAGALMAVWGQIGDITESAFKRRFNVKDSGALIPGHGGILDRVDAIVFVAPVVALFLLLRPVGGL